MRALTAYLILTCSVSAVQAAIRHVPTEYQTIQAAINASLDGDTVLVAPGTYNESIDFLGKLVVLISEAGAAETIISPSRDQTAIRLVKNEPKGTEIRGFTIQGGWEGIRCAGSSPTIRDNIVSGSRRDTFAGILMFSTSCSLIERNVIRGVYLLSAIQMDGVCNDDTIAYNLLYDNWSWGEIRCQGTTNRLQILNNTIVADQYTGIKHEGLGSMSVYRNIIVGAALKDVTDSNSIGDLQYNCSVNCGGYSAILYSPTNIVAHPQFCDTAHGDFGISSLSPCSPRNNSGKVLIGAFGVSCNLYPCGDVDLDGKLTTNDIIFLQNLYFFSPPTGYFPLVRADFNCDGVITISDILILANYYYGRGPVPCCAEPPPPPKPNDVVDQAANIGN